MFEIVKERKVIERDVEEDGLCIERHELFEWCSGTARISGQLVVGDDPFGLRAAGEHRDASGADCARRSVGAERTLRRAPSWTASSARRRTSGSSDTPVTTSGTEARPSVDSLRANHIEDRICQSPRSCRETHETARTRCAGARYRPLSMPTERKHATSCGESYDRKLDERRANLISLCSQRDSILSREIGQGPHPSTSRASPRLRWQANFAGSFRASGYQPGTSRPSSDMRTGT